MPKEGRGQIDDFTRRNKGQRGWQPKLVQSLHDEREQVCINGQRFSSECWAEAVRLIREDLSPEQTAHRLPGKDKCHIITFDNGKKFTGHETISAQRQTSICFAHPDRSWERGLNENSNGLFRQYFPKGMELTDVTEERMQQAVQRLNHQPRKVLGFRSPHKMSFGVEMRYTKPT